jgi:hypothetical protein
MDVDALRLLTPVVAVERTNGTRYFVGTSEWIGRCIYAVLRSYVPVVPEYWPYGLRWAGGLDLLHSIIAENYSMVIDLLPPRASSSFRAQDIHQLAARYEGGLTDLLLIK